MPRTTDPTLAALFRLRARLGRERAKAERQAQEAATSPSLASYGRGDVRMLDAVARAYTMAQALVGAEIRRVKDGPCSPYR